MSKEMVNELTCLAQYSDINCGYPSLLELKWKEMAKEDLQEAQKSLIEFVKGKTKFNREAHLAQALYVLASLPYEEGKFGLELVEEGLKSDSIWCNECALSVLEQWENLEVAEKMLADFHSEEKWLQEYRDKVLEYMKKLQKETI